MAPPKRSRSKLYDIQWPIVAQQIENINANFDRLFTDLYAADTAALFADNILAAEWGGTGLGTYTIGDLLYADGEHTLAALPAGTAGYHLASGGAATAPSWVTNLHNLLSATHPDTTAAAVVRGDLIAGIGVSPKWERLAKGSATHILTMGANEPSWAAPVSQTSALLSATHTDTTAAAVVRGDLIAGIGVSPKWERLTKGTSGYALIMGADDPAWTAIPYPITGSGTLNVVTKFTAAGAIGDTPWTDVGGILRGLTDPTAPTDAATKEYVDLAVRSLEITEFYTNAVVSPNLYTMDNAATAAGTVTSLSTVGAADVLMFSFITPVGHPNLDRMLQGMYDSHFHMKIATAGSTIVAYFKLRHCDAAGGTLATLGTQSDNSDPLTSDNLEYNVHLYLAAEVTFALTDRIRIDFYGTHTAGAAKSVIMAIGGVDNSHFSLRVDATELTAIFVPYSGAVHDLTMGTKVITAAGFNGLVLTETAGGFTIEGGTGSQTLTVTTTGTLGTAAYTPVGDYSPVAGSSSIVTVGTITSGIWNAGALTSSGAIKERARATALGEWITPAFSAGNFTAINAMTWTVGAGDVITYAYTLIGKTMVVVFAIHTSSIGGTPDAYIYIAIPGGFTAAKQANSFARIWENGADSSGIVYVLPGGSVINIIIQGGGNFAASTDTTYVQGEIVFEIS